MATAALEPRKYETYEDGDFVVYENVPVWKEHVNEDGVRFDKAALDRVVARCNHRIEDTGDFSAITLRHTDDGASDFIPPVVGFAGPYSLVKLGNLKPLWHIVADKFRIFKEDNGEARNTRESPLNIGRHWMTRPTATLIRSHCWARKRRS